jgi:plastocyanin
MKISQRIILGAALLIMGGCQSAGSTESLPTVTRTGDVKDITIREELNPASLTVNPGDEIRWINKRQGTVKVIFLDPVMEMMSCQRNFGGLMGMNPQRNQFTAKLSSNDSASLCFKNPTQLRYVVRADSNLPSGEVNLPGTIIVGSSGDQSSSRSPQGSEYDDRNIRQERAQGDQELGSKDQGR